MRARYLITYRPCGDLAGDLLGCDLQETVVRRSCLDAEERFDREHPRVVRIKPVERLQILDA